MNTFKRVLRLIGLALLLSLALSGLGMFILPSSREKYKETEIRIELVEKKDTEHNEAFHNTIKPI